jgi:hypothetical protein
MATTNRPEEVKMESGLKCDCCHSADAEYVVCEPTDACERGTLFCAKCSTATSAGMAPIHYADEAEGETLIGGELVEYEGTVGVVSNRGGTIGRYSLRMPRGEVNTLRRSDFKVLFAPEPEAEEYPRCEKCGEPIDYCQGHGEIAEAVAAGRPVVESALDNVVEALTLSRRMAAERALDRIAKLRGELNRMEDAVQAAGAGEACSTLSLTPSHQTLHEIVECGTELQTLWNAVGVAMRAGEEN